MNTVQPLSQDSRPKVSIILDDADLSLNNSNYTKGLESMSDWIWSANLNPYAFPNNLARFFLQIPGVYEQQLNFSTSLIFDEPSFKNGVQISGFVNRVHKELVISLIARTRRAWYTMTHHALLGTLTAVKLGMSKETFANKMYYLSEVEKHPEFYTRLELKILGFAYAFATNPKSLSDRQLEDLKTEFRQFNKENYQKTDYWILKQEAANLARSKALAGNIKLDDKKFPGILNEYISRVPLAIPDELNEQKVNSQLVELSFLCLQFVALATVFTALNIPDESAFAGVMAQQVSPKVIEKINEYNEMGLAGETPELLPLGIEDIEILLKALDKGQLKVEPARLKGSRIPLTPYEGKDANGQFKPAFSISPDKDKGLTVGGVQAGVYGWNFGGHGPGGLIYCLMHHPELARFETQYSLPLLFNEDEWRNGVQTAGYVSRKLKELVIQKVYQSNRSRYGLEHHMIYLYSCYLNEYGLGSTPNPDFSREQVETIREKALKHAGSAVLNILKPEDAPSGIFSRLELKVLAWVGDVLRKPHTAYKKEEEVKAALNESNLLEIECGLRVLDTSPNIGNEAAMKRLIDHQVAELIMLTGHMDGLGRLLSILKIESEEAVQMVEGRYTGKGGIKPELDADGQVRFTGYFNNRAGLFDILNSLGISQDVQSFIELLVNPALSKNIINQLKTNPNKTIIAKSMSEGSAEF